MADGRQLMRVHTAPFAVLLSLVAPLVAVSPQSAETDQTPVVARTLPQCTALASLSLRNATITLATTIDEGTSVPIVGTTQSVVAPRAFCRVAATLRPSGDSDIKVEVWLPVSGWNQKFQGVGNGGFNGAMAYGAMVTALRRGYATASTDTGHAGTSASFALGHPEKVVDFGWRAVREMTVAAKLIVAAYYESGPRLSYWNGCSAGGRQAMKEAQRFPADYDGIIAGAPGLDWTGRAAQAVRIAKVLEADESARLPQAARQRLHRAALAACDASDGLQDGLISSPEHCAFDPAVLQCTEANATDCLNQAQAATAQLIYSSPVNPRTRRPIPGLLPGSELGWTDLGWTASARATGLDQFRFLVFGDPTWTIQQFNFDTDIVRAEQSDDNTINALDPDLKAFVTRGGKLIQYHGWSDPQISPAISTQYYARVAQALGGAARLHDSYRLFMAPGMGHCSGGAGPNTFDALAALEAWVEEGRAPDRILASHSTQGVVDRTRPLCPYPQIAAYTGTGSVDDAANFVCGLADRTK
jgi:feruloyl esterase